jgi:hypothetical protein
MYRHMDSYPSEHGRDLAEFLTGLGEYNGASCLAAQLVAHFKTEPYGIYLEPPEARNMGEEFIYWVDVMANPNLEPSNIQVTVAEVLIQDEYEIGPDIFKGSVEEFAKWIEEEGGRY